MRRTSILVFVAAVTVSAPGTARAQTFERITRYEELITVDASGSVLVQQTIDYDFAGTQHHGIFVDVPVKFRYDSRYDRVTPLEVVSVEASGGASADYSVERNGGQDEIRIGDPNSTVTGEHTYAITYRMEGVLNGFPDHAELYWNAVGPDWGVPIDNVSVSVAAPASITQVACFSGPVGSSLPCAHSGADGTTASFNESSLGPGQTLTVVVGLPKGAVPDSALRPILQERWSLGRALAVTPFSGTLAVLLLIVGAGSFSLLVWKTGRDRRYVGSAVDIAFGSDSGREQTVPVFEQALSPIEYTPPDGVRPGQVGTLIDETAGPLDVSATIVDLAVRKYLVIEEIPRVGIFGRTDWKLTQLKNADTALMPYEQRLLNGLFESGSPVQLSELRTHFVKRLARVEDALYEDAVHEGWFSSRPDRVRHKWTLIGLAGFALFALVEYALIRFTHLGLVGIPLVVTGMAFAVGAKWMPRRTAKGTGTVRRVLGFKRFIDGSEADRSKIAEKEDIFSEYLPYAIVFGCTKKWAKVFEQLGRQPPTTLWYVSPNPFTVAAFAESIEGFSVYTVGAIASTPAGSGSSGFGGGGFAGGGFGGGGGGSW